MPEMDYFDQDDYSDLKKGGIAHTLYRIEANVKAVSGTYDIMTLTLIQGQWVTLKCGK